MTAIAKKKTVSIAFWTACAVLPIILFCGLAIWGGVFLLSMPAGALLERRARQRRTAGAPAGENEKEAPPGPDGAQHLS